MTSTRIGFAEDFSLKNQLVGIGTNQQEVKLRVVGTIKGDFNVKDETTLSVYSGFIVQNYNINVPSVLSYTSDNVGTFTRVNERETDYLKLEGEYNTLSEDIIVDEDRIFEVSDDSLVSVGTLESVSIQSNFSVPDGGTNERPDQPVEGMVRFNDDLNTLEFYNGIEWRQFTVSGASGRGVFGGGWDVSVTQIRSMDYINIHTSGNAISFGDLLSTSRMNAGCSSSIRGLFGSSYPSPLDQIEYFTIASEGNTIDFGNLTSGRQHLGAHSSSTRGIFAGGAQTVSAIEYVEISTLGNAISFGNLSAGRRNLSGCGSPIRAIFSQGGEFPAAVSNNDYITIASKGNGIEFLDGDYRSGIRCCSNTTRGLYGGGYVPTKINTIDYLTIASLGNMTDFGDLTRITQEGAFISSQTRGVYSGGFNDTSPLTASNSIEYVTIATTGNAIDFGDSTVYSAQRDGTSDSHGGLGGF